MYTKFWYYILMVGGGGDDSNAVFKIQKKTPKTY